MYNHPANDLQIMDQRLIEIYGEEQCLKWKKEAPGHLNYYAFELTKGHCIASLNTINLEGIELEDLESFDPVNFPVDEILEHKNSFMNPHRYNIKRSFFGRKYYKIGLSNFALILLSGEELRKMFENG